MAKKAAKKSKKRSRTPGKKKKTEISSSPAQQTSGDAAQEAASQRFVSDLLVRGEAAERDREGKLPLRATHVIKGKKPDGTADIKRVRFKAF